MKFWKLASATTALVLSTSVNAAIITDSSSGEILGATGLSILGETYNVSFVQTTSSNVSEQALLWNDYSSFSAARSSLISELNTSSSYIVNTSDGLRNNDFYMIYTETSDAYTASHIRSTPTDPWFIYRFINRYHSFLHNGIFY